MSRKTNKTAHVLNLITGGSKSEIAPTENAQRSPSEKMSQAEDHAPAQGTPQAADPEQTQNTQQAEAPAAPPQAADAQQAEKIAPTAGDALMKNIKRDDNTDKEKNFAQSGKFQKFMTDRLLSRAQSRNAAPIVEILFNDHDPLSDVIRDQLYANEAMEEALRGRSTIMDTDKLNDTLFDSQGSSPFVTHDASGKVTIKTTDGSESDALDYKFVNVFEELVRARVIETMQKFDVCTCDRCIIDVIALTLTNLPSKCIVADKDAIFPLLSYYSTKYNTQVQTELVKACVRVKEVPHHRR